jgi:hypothetical protein
VVALIDEIGAGPRKAIERASRVALRICLCVPVLIIKDLQNIPSFSRGVRTRIFCTRAAEGWYSALL